MKLAAYLEAESLKLDDFAKRIGVAHAAVVSRYARGQRIPRPGVMARIVAETDGAVTPADFYATPAE